nr:hypothetical protein [Tanacetum cinerariifolium]
MSASYWTAASDVAATSAPVNAAGHRSTADHGGDRRSTVAVNDSRRWRTTVDCRWITVDHHRTTGQWWLMGWSTLGPGPVWIESRSDADVDNMQRVGIDPGTLSYVSTGQRRSIPPATGQRRRITVVIGGQRWRSTTVAGGEPPLTAAGPPPLTTTGPPVNGGWWAGQS